MKKRPDFPTKKFIYLANKKTTVITTATLQVKEREYYGTFTDIDDNKYLVRSIKNYENIRKQQIKSFVY